MDAFLQNLKILVANMQAYVNSLKSQNPSPQQTQPLPNTQVPTTPSVPPIASKLLWDTRDNCRHSVRVICDQEGLTVQQKNLLSQVIHCESDYNPACVHPNIVGGRTTSTDYGICQWNNYFHGNEISPHDALTNPEKAVRLMCQYVKEGKISQWVCYSKGMYKMYAA